jgi:sugar phosphate isomerase/epimerase
MLPLIITPVSHLFFESNSVLISENSDGLEIREHTVDLNLENVFAMHWDLDIIRPWAHEEKLNIEKTINKFKKIELATFQLSNRCSKINVVNGVFQVESSFLSEQEMRENARNNIEWFRTCTKNSVNIGLENNNHLGTPAYDVVTEGFFISRIVDENNIYFLLDIAHAMISAHHFKIHYEDYLSTLPMNALVQLHICEPIIDNLIVLDAHEIPSEEMLEHVKKLLSQYHGIKYLTIEYYKDTNKLITVLKKLRSMIKEKYRTDA